MYFLSLGVKGLNASSSLHEKNVSVFIALAVSRNTRLKFHESLPIPVMKLNASDSGHCCWPFTSKSTGISGK